ncbi:MAG: tetratricopeptide repeat protein [Ahrensia sp.]
MSDDSFIREVEEELRSDRLQSVWDRFGKIIIGVAVAIVLAVVANTAWKSYVDGQATASGDRFRNALTLASEGQTDEAMAALQALQEDGYGEYPILARMREATLLHNSGDADGAVAAFDAISNDNGVDVVLRDLAKLRAAYILVDSGTYGDVAARAEALAVDTSPMRHGAREALGLAAYKEQRYGDAQALFSQLTGDQATPPPMVERANIMLDLIRATGQVDQG